MLLELTKTHIPALGPLWVTCDVDSDTCRIVKVELELPQNNAFAFADITPYYEHAYGYALITTIAEWYREHEARLREGERENAGMDAAKEARMLT